MTRRNGRILAFQALFAWEVGNVDPVRLTEFAWSETRKTKSGSVVPDFTFARFLFLGALEHIQEIDDEIKKHLVNWDFDRVNKVDLSILRLSVYTLLYQRDVHPTIVIDEAIDIAKDFSQDESYKFINAVLDNIRKTCIKG
jgi:N utilization substance protein B